MRPAVRDVLSTDDGVTSTAVIAVMPGRGGFCIRCFIRRLQQDEARERARRP